MWHKRKIKREENNSIEKSPLGLILLAAGESKRFDGFPKQLLRFQGKSLLRHAAETALNSSADLVCVVLGANAEKVKTEIEDLPLAICVNEKPDGGMASSLKKGLKNLLEIEPELKAAGVMLADQPLINAENLQHLIDIYQSDKHLIAASEYDGTIGVPAIFSRAFFDEILALEPSAGAKNIILQHLAVVRKIPLPEAAFDIDTPSDYEKLKEHFRQEM